MAPTINTLVYERAHCCQQIDITSQLLMNRFRYAPLLLSVFHFVNL